MSLNTRGRRPSISPRAGVNREKTGDKETGEQTDIFRKCECLNTNTRTSLLSSHSEVHTSVPTTGAGNSEAPGGS